MTFVDKLKNYKRTLRYFFIKNVISLMLFLPVRSINKLMRLLLKLASIVFKKQLLQAKKNLPDEMTQNSEKILKKMSENYIMTFLEVIFYDKLVKEIPNYIRFENLDYFIEEAKTGQGVLLLSAHFGNWELIGYALAKLGHPLHVIAKPQAINQMTKLMNSFRQERGSVVIMNNNILHSLKLLKQGKHVGLLSDLDAKKSGYLVDFFEKKASFYSVPVILATKSKAPVIPVFAYRQPDGTHIISFEQKIDFSKANTMSEKIQVYVDCYQKIFRKRPDHWCWFHARYAGVHLGRKG